MAKAKFERTKRPTRASLGLPWAAKAAKAAKPLKPCPFCGGKKLNICDTEFLGEPEPRPAYAISCRSVGCHGDIFMLGHGEFETEADAIAAWNERN